MFSQRKKLYSMLIVLSAIILMNCTQPGTGDRIESNISTSRDANSVSSLDLSDNSDYIKMIVGLKESSEAVSDVATEIEGIINRACPKTTRTEK